MVRVARLSIVALLLLAACGDRNAEVPSDSAAGPLAPAQLDGIADPAIIAAIAELFPAGQSRNHAFAYYGRIRVRALTGDMDGAVAEVFGFLHFALRLLQRGILLGPDPGGALADLFAMIFEELGVEGPPLSGFALGEGGFAIGLIGPEGGRVTAPNKHGAIAFDPGMLSGPTWVVVAQLPNPADPGECPFGFPVENDCYPLFFDYSVFPESNLTGEDPPRIGQCVIEEGPLAPPNEMVEMRLRIASELNGMLVFWPMTEAPSTVDCTDLEMAAWQSDLMDLLGPFARVFKVTPLYANPGRLGASVSSFSPFAPADPVIEEPDPEVEGTIEGVVLTASQTPVSGATVQLRELRGDYMDSTTTGMDGTFEFTGLPIGPEGTTYRVRTGGRTDSDSEDVTLTEEDPEAFVVLMVGGGPVDVITE